MKSFIKGTVAIGMLLTVASCSSDSKSTAKTTADSTVVTTAASTGASTADTTAATTAPSTAVTTGALDTSGLDPLQAQALTISVASAASLGVTIDPVCLAKVVAKMTDADAQLIIDGGVGGTPTLSPAGEALSPEAQACTADGGTVTTP